MSVVHIVMKMKKWKLSFWSTDANSVRKMAKILPSSGKILFFFHYPRRSVSIRVDPS